MKKVFTSHLLESSLIRRLAQPTVETRRRSAIPPSRNLPKPIAVSKPLALLLFILAGLTGAAYRLRSSAPASSDTTTALESSATDSLTDTEAPSLGPVQRVMDEADFLDDYDATGLAGYLGGINVESGVDIRFIFARGVEGSLESYTLRRARELGLGRDMNKRSMLFVYDVAGKRMRVEVGPGMEGMFPDGFVGFLVREQTALVLASGDRRAALKSTLNVVSHRLREAALGGTYNPRAVAYIANPVRLAAGAGATVRAPMGGSRRRFGERISADEARAYFKPQPTVAAAHARYLEALATGQYAPDLPLYTPETQLLFRGSPMGRPFADFILYSEYGHKYKIVERGDLAILFFTTTPLVSAHLFRRFPDGWRLDVAAEVQDTREFVGGPHTWGMMLTGDDYTRTFGDLFADYGDMGVPERADPRPGPNRVLRPAAGDNRPLPTRKGRDAPPVRLPVVRARGESRLLLPAVRNKPEDLGYPTQTIDRLAIRGLLLARSYDSLEAVLSAYADSVVRDYRMEYRLFDAYAAFGVAIPSLEPLLNDWVNQRPGSVAALVARGTYLHAAGWHARGSESGIQTSRNQINRMTGFFRRGAADFNAALRLSPNSLVAYRALISIASVDREPAAARELLDRALKIQPYSFRLRAAYMNYLLPRWGGSYGAMTKFAEESAPYAARNPRIRALAGYVDWDRGRVLESGGKKEDAIEAYGRALRFGNYWQFRFERGELYFHADDSRKALDDLNAVLLQHPQHASALYQRAWVSYDLGLAASGEARGQYFARAFEDIETAVALDPTDTYFQKYLSFIRENIPEYAPPPRP
jgi:tetratricopeptide (TPR) repeat protein